MAIDYSAIAKASPTAKRLGKGEPRSRVKRRQRREEGTVKRTVREQCWERDGYCRVGIELLTAWHCGGPSEWAHLAGRRRSQTVHEPPTARHTTKTTAMLCRTHHQWEEAGRLRLVPLTGDGMDGPIRVEFTR